MVARRLAAMPAWEGVARDARRGALASLIAHGLLAPRDLPLRIVPADPRALEGWRFD
jgi:hypothetical protein